MITLSNLKTTSLYITKDEFEQKMQVVIFVMLHLKPTSKTHRIPKTYETGCPTRWIYSASVHVEDDNDRTMMIMICIHPLKMISIQVNMY